VLHCWKFSINIINKLYVQAHDLYNWNKKNTTITLTCLWKSIINIKRHNNTAFSLLFHSITWTWENVCHSNQFYHKTFVYIYTTECCSMKWNKNTFFGGNYYTIRKPSNIQDGLKVHCICINKCEFLNFQVFIQCTTSFVTLHKSWPVQHWWRRHLFSVII